MWNCYYVNDPDRQLICPKQRDESAPCKTCEELAKRDLFWAKWFKGGIIRQFFRPMMDGADEQTKAQIPNHPFPTYPKVGFNEFTTPAVTAWKLTRAAIEHENNLVNQRLTWLLTSQAFLLTVFAGLFAAWGKPQDLGELHPLIPHFMLGIGLLAIYICLVIQNSLWRAFTALGTLTWHYDTLTEASGFFHDVKDKNNRNIKVAMVPPLHLWTPPFLRVVNQHFLPGAVLFVWLGLLALCEFHRSPVIRELINHIEMKHVLWALMGLCVLILGVIIRWHSVRPHMGKSEAIPQSYIESTERSVSENTHHLSDMETKDRTDYY